MGKTNILYRLAKKAIYILQLIQSMTFRLRYRKTFVFGKNCIIQNCKVHHAKRGKVIVGSNVKLLGCHFHFEKGINKIVIGENCYLVSTQFIERFGGENTIVVGKDTTTGGTCQFEASEGTTLHIGEDCMFSHNIKVWTTPYHSILNEEGKRINPAAAIKIGNHCWIGHSSFILKGSIVPDGSIVGATSLYTGKYTDTNSVYAGSPAIKIKENIYWSRDLKPIDN